MTPDEMNASIDQIIDALKTSVQRAIGPLRKRIEVLEKRPELHYEGVFVEGKSYEPGALVTRSGSLWLATASTNGVPGDGQASWKMIVKQGKV